MECISTCHWDLFCRIGVRKETRHPEIDFVDMPNAVQSQVIVQNLVDLKMSDPDYFPVLIANQILGGGGEGR